MSYRLYTTKALVLGVETSVEASRSLRLFTRELGFIRAHARGVREGKSKLRYGLQPLSLSEVSLVRGREMWRVAGAMPLHSLHASFRESPETFLLLVRIVRLLRRLLQGEEKNEELFDVVESGIEFLLETSLTKSELGNFECVFVLRILHRLGYIGNPEFEPFLGLSLSKDLMVELAPLRSSAILAINKSLRETHL